MEFIVSGFDRKKAMVKMNLPAAKHFQINAVKSGELDLRVKELVSQAAGSMRLPHDFFYQSRNLVLRNGV